MDISKPYNNTSHPQKVEKYYRFHSRIYDVTRWSFLFGREQILDLIPDLPTHPRVMEVGCGTGKNIQRLQYHLPDAHILGIDLSEDMLSRAAQKVEGSSHVAFRQCEYGSESSKTEPCDLILLSYSLTMMGENIEEIMQQLSRDLKPGGYVAVVDFNTSPLSWFRQWMHVNHVDLTGRLLPLLKKFFMPVHTEIKPAYLGLWSYFLFIGRQS